MTQDLLIGSGEVGSALLEVLSERREFAIHDPPKGIEAKHLVKGYDWCHICIPYSEAFLGQVSDVIEEFNPSHLVIHSTVPVGTCTFIDSKIPWPHLTYSPIRGIHPQLARYIRSFPKWFYTGDNYESRAFEVYMAQAGIQTRKAMSFDMLELQKLFETCEYGYRIALWQEIEREILALEPAWARNGEKYERAISDMKAWLWEKRVAYDGDRGLCPIMYGGYIGGHCVENNWNLQKERMLPEFYAWLTKSNEMRKEK